MTNETIVSNIKQNVDRNFYIALLCEKNNGIVTSLAKGFLFTGEPLEDLKQVGFIGLIVAVGHFEQSKEVKFISYAAFWIKCELQRHAERCTGLKLSANAQALLYKLKRLEADYKTRFGRVPTDTETSELLGIPLKKINELRGYNVELSSLDAPTGEDGASLGDMIRSERNEIEEAEKRIDLEQLRGIIWHEVDALGSPQAEIMKLKYIYGLNMKEVSNRLDMDYQRARGLEVKAVNTLRRNKSFIKQLEPFTDIQAYNVGLHHTSLTAFRLSGCSSQEWAVIKAEERVEKRANRPTKI